MNRQKLSQQAMWTILMMLLLVGCSAPAATPTSEPLPGPNAEWIEITCGENGCTVSGPTKLSTGEHSFVLKGLSEQNQQLYLAYYINGKTFQDLLDLQDEPGEFFPKPHWAIHPTLLDKSWDDSIGGEVYTFRFDEGEYGIAVDNIYGFWLCSSFQVIEAPSE